MLDCCAAYVPIFSGLDDESLIKIMELAVHRNIPKGTILNSPENSDGLFLIANGMVKVFTLTESGAEVIIRVLRKGDFSGIETLFDVPTESISMTLTDASLCFISREGFRDLLERYPSISLQLLREYEIRTRQLETRLVRESTESAEVRTVRYLQQLRLASSDDSIIIPISLKELAGILGMSPETLSRTMKKLERANAILRVSNHHYAVNSDILQSII